MKLNGAGNQGCEKYSDLVLNPEISEKYSIFISNYVGCI